MKSGKRFAFVFKTILLSAIASAAYTQSNNIKNDIFWNTVNGEPIYSKGGGIFLFKDSLTGKQQYYWYGVHYKEADTYRNDPSVTLKNASFQSVTCYISTDLVNWTFAGGHTSHFDINHENSSWMSIRINDIIVKTDKIEIGFIAEGDGGSFCYVDDVALIKN